MQALFSLLLAVSGFLAVLASPMAAMAAVPILPGIVNGEGSFLLSNSRKKRILYLRYSTVMQRGESLEDQERNILAYLDRLGIDHRGYIVIVDRAVTGTTMDRKGIKKLLGMLERNEIEWVAFDDLSRLSRTSMMAVLWDKFTAKRVRIFSAIDGLDSNDESAEMVAKFKGVINESSNKIHGRRTRRGIAGRVLDGNSSYGSRPFGYTSKFTNSDEAERWRATGGPRPKKTDVIDPEQAAVVMWIFTAYAEWGWTLTDIARDLNKRGVPLGSRSVHKGDGTQGQVKWHKDLIAKILRQRKYIGDWRWGETATIKDAEGKRNVHPAKPGMAIRVERPDMVIVPLPLWEKVQARLAENQEKYGIKEGRKQRGANTDGYAFDPVADRLYCGVCGHKLQCAGGGSGVGYRCPVALNGGALPDGTVCTNHGWVMLDRATAALVHYLGDDLAACPEWLGAVHKSLVAEFERLLRDTPTELQRRQERRRELEQDIARLLDLLKKRQDSDALLDDLARTEDEKSNEDHAIRLLEANQKAFDALPDMAWIQKELRDLPGVLADDPRRAGMLYRDYFGRVLAYPKVMSGKKRGAMELRFMPDRTQLVRSLMPSTAIDEESPEPEVVGDQPEVCINLGGNDKLDKLMPTIHAMRQRGVHWRMIEKELGVSRGHAIKCYRAWLQGQAAASGEPVEAVVQDDAAPILVESMPSVPEEADVMYAHSLYPETASDTGTPPADAPDDVTAS